MNKDIQILTSEHNGLIGNLIHEFRLKKTLTVYNTALKEFNINVSTGNDYFIHIREQRRNISKRH